MDPTSLYVQLGRLSESIPDFNSTRPLPPATQMWLARLQALLSAAGYGVDAGRIKALTGSISSSASNTEVHEIHSILFRTLAIAELEAPAPSQGAFIPVGNAFDALVAVGNVLKLAKDDLLIVDPYLDEKVLTDFALQISEGVPIRLLTDEEEHKATLSPAVRRWIAQYKTQRPLSVRLSPHRALHDRLIFIDDREVYDLSQSLNAFAARSPASISRAGDDTAALKIPAYKVLWDAAKPL